MSSAQRGLCLTELADHPQNSSQACVSEKAEETGSEEQGLLVKGSSRWAQPRLPAARDAAILWAPLPALQGM